MSANEPSTRLALAAAIKRARLTRGYSISRLAQEAGIAKATVSRWENCETQPGVFALESICSVLALSEADKLELLAMIDAPRSVRARRGSSASGDALDQAMPTAGDLLKALRMRAGLRSDQLAAELGVCAATISKWERSERLPTADNVERLADVLRAADEEKVMIGRASLVAPRAPALSELREEYSLVLDDLGKRQVSGMDLRFLVVESKAWNLARREKAALELLGDALSCHSVYLAEVRRWSESYRYASLSASLPYHTARFDPHVTMGWRHFVKGNERSIRIAISYVTDGFLQAKSVGSKLQTLGHRMRYYSELGLYSLMERDAETAYRIAQPCGPDRIAFWNWMYADALMAAGRPEKALEVIPLARGSFFMLPIHVACTWAEALIRTNERASAEPYLQQLRTYEQRFGRLNYDETRVLAMA